MEEAGLAIDALRDLEPGDRSDIRRPVAEGYMVEHIEVFAARLPSGLVPVNRDGEVERFECLDDARCCERLAAGAFTLEAVARRRAAIRRRRCRAARRSDVLRRSASCLAFDER